MDLIDELMSGFSYADWFLILIGFCMNPSVTDIGKLVYLFIIFFYSKLNYESSIFALIGKKNRRLFLYLTIKVLLKSRVYSGPFW